LGNSLLLKRDAMTLTRWSRWFGGSRCYVENDRCKRDLVDAVNHARTRVTLSRTAANKFEPEITFAAWDDGLSVRSSFAAMDIDGQGSWPSPIMVAGAPLRLLVPKLSGPDVVLTYKAGQMHFNETVLTAREV
jgi:hypothetical protein